MVGMSQNEIISTFGLRNATVSRDEILCSCPFSHNHPNGDRHPSFRLNSEKGVYLCYACGEKGNIVQLAEKVLGMTPFEARSTFSADLTDDAIDGLMKAQGVERKALTPLQADVSGWAGNSHPYWRMRGFNDATIGKWGLGYDPVDDRVVVPVYFKGMLVGWSKRAVDDFTMPKWKHSHDMPKSDILFGMDNFNGDSAVLVEAPLSVIMLDQYGISNAVASFGCKLSDAQARLIRANYNNVLIFYDPDEPGQRGARDAAGKLERFVDVYMAPVTRDDPAAMTLEEDVAAIGGALPLWAWDIERG